MSDGVYRGSAKPRLPKFVQVATSTYGHTGDYGELFSTLYALDEEGRVWFFARDQRVEGTRESVDGWTLHDDGLLQDAEERVRRKTR